MSVKLKKQTNIKAVIDMSENEARAFAEDLKKSLIAKNIWCTILEHNEPKLKFIKVEASIKVRQ